MKRCSYLLAALNMEVATTCILTWGICRGAGFFGLWALLWWAVGLNTTEDAS